jgi:hypothetical protein
MCDGLKPVGEELIAMSPFLQQTFSQNHNIKPKYIIENAVDVELYNIADGKRDIDIMGAGSLIL